MDAPDMPARRQSYEISKVHCGPSRRRETKTKRREHRPRQATVWTRDCVLTKPRRIKIILLCTENKPSQHDGCKDESQEDSAEKQVRSFARFCSTQHQKLVSREFRPRLVTMVRMINHAEFVSVHDVSSRDRHATKQSANLGPAAGRLFAAPRCRNLLFVVDGWELPSSAATESSQLSSMLCLCPAALLCCLCPALDVVAFTGSCFGCLSNVQLHQVAQIRSFCWRAVADR